MDSQVLIFRLVNDSEVLPCNGLLIEDIRRCSTLFNQLHYSRACKENVILLLIILLGMLRIFPTFLRGWSMFYYNFFL